MFTKVLCTLQVYANANYVMWDDSAGSMVAADLTMAPETAILSQLVWRAATWA